MLLSTLLEKIEYFGSFVDCEVDHITNDSREARSTSVFVCIKGFSTDGHFFAQRAYDNGCRVFVCEYQPNNLSPDATVIVVQDSRKALALISCALYGNPSSELTVIGITGTKGKTTTALMIKQLLDKVGMPSGYIGSNGILFGNTKIEAVNTTPESYKLHYYMKQMLDCGMRAVVLEVSSQALKLNRVLGIDFDITVFSNLSPDHIGPGEHEIFKEYFDATPAEYIKECRVEKACELLRSTRLPVCEIAEICGIPDYNYFSKIFKRKLGISPREFRKDRS